MQRNQIGLSEKGIAPSQGGYPVLRKRVGLRNPLSVHAAALSLWSWWELNPRFRRSKVPAFPVPHECLGAPCCPDESLFRMPNRMNLSFPDYLITLFGTTKQICPTVNTFPVDIPRLTKILDEAIRPG
jgi:hypothetical protein